MSLITTRRLVLGFILILNAGFCFAQKKEEKKYPALLWQITGNGLTKPSYLFGTMHVSSKMVFNLGDSFYSGIKNSDVVALELDPQLWQDQMSRFQVMQNNLRLYTQGSPNDYLNEKSFQIENYEDKLKAALSEEPTIINGLLYRTFQQRADFEEDTYLDLYIYQTGKKLGKQATGVENYFETEKLIVEATQDMMKDKNRRNHDGDGESVYELERKTEEAYRQGDLDLLDSLERIMQPSDAYMEKFLYRRNEIQANSIDSILKKHSLFVGVGAAHLPGKRGVIELLRQKGYNLRPISIQARDASERDEIDKIKVPVKFSYLTSDDGSFSVKLPGKFYKRADSRYNDDSWQYADMSNGSYYMVTSVKTYNQFVGQNSDLVFKKIDSLLYENIPGKILKKNIIERNGYKGFDITNKTRRGDIQRYNIIVTPFEVLVFKMSGVGNYVDGDEANIFFGSITLKRNNVENWANYEPSAGGFKIKLPQQPFVTKNTSGFDGIRWEYESNDSINGDAYLILRKSLNNYRFLDEDSFQLSMMAESFRLSDYIDKNVETKYTIRNNQPVIESKYKLKDGSYIRARYFIKGPNYYVLAAHSKIDKTFPEFFNSFSFQSFYYPEFTDYIDSITSFKVSTPVIPDIDTDMRNIYERATSEEFLNSVSEHNGYWPRNKTALFRDDSTGEAVYVSVERFPKYYFPKDSASFWKDEANEKRIKENFIIHSKERFRLNDSAIGYKYIFSDTGSSRFICNWMFLKNNRLYRVISLNDSLQQSDFVKHFYASINPLEKQNDASVFSDKLDLFFHDFYSKDSATNQKAKAAIQNVYFGAHGADRLLHAIQSLPYNNKDYFETKAKLIDELGYINDSSVINHIVEGLKKIYERADDTSMIQNAVFRALAKNKTKESYHLLKTLLLQDPPVFDNSSDYNYFFQDLGDSLALAGSLFPELLQLSTLDDYKNNVRSLLASLVDSNYLKADDYNAYFSKIYFDAKIQLKKQIARDEEKMQRSNDEDERYSEADKDADNDLDDYSVLLLPFYEKNPAVPKFFDKLLQSKNASLRISTLTLLLRNNKPVADSIIQNLAKDDKYRFQLLKHIESIGMKEKFPKQYASQLDIAKSAMEATRPSKSFFSVEYVDKRLIQVKQKKGWVYFFKYKSKKDDTEWKIGISGLQPENLKNISSNNDIVLISVRNIKKDQPLMEQFDKQLKHALFSKYKSGASFYLDNGYYINRNNTDDDN